ncbi:MAG: hypothetical protein V2J62_06145 [candidate division KSB1 bacterium]|jgi:hypothetical protein|nr:hypothetical protein [candidate division KSB1 bacterium]
MKKIINKRFIGLVLVLLLFLLAELIFDVVEIGVGFVLETTNAFRPKTGTVWELNQSDRTAREQISHISGEGSERDNQLNIAGISDLKKILEEKNTVFITRDQLLSIYNDVPPRLARAIVPPLDLLKVIQSQQWVRTKIVKTDKTLNFYLMDGKNQLIYDSYPDRSLFYGVHLELNTNSHGLESMDEFSSRIFTSGQFFSTFCDLPNSIKLQLINDPYFLIRYHKRIVSVAISRYSHDGIVNLGFDVRDGSNGNIKIFQSSLISANYLISGLNEKYSDLEFSFPEPKYEIID